MDDTWFQVLVIIMSVLLITILVITIVIGIWIARVVKIIRNITNQAQSLVDKADHVATFFEKTAAPMAIVKLLSNISASFMNGKKSKK